MVKAAGPRPRLRPLFPSEVGSWIAACLVQSAPGKPRSKRGGGFLAGPWSARSAGDSPQRREAKCGTSAAGSSSPDFWLSAAVVKRHRPKYLRLRDPEWRSDMAVRLGFPVLGAVAAVAFAWLIIKT